MTIITDSNSNFEIDSMFSGNKHEQRIRPSIRFLECDTYQGMVNDPLSLHKYLYVSADPVNLADPTGHFALLDTLGAAAIGAGEFVQDVGMAGVVGGLALTVASALTYTGASLGMAIDAVTGDTSDLAYLQEQQAWATEGMMIGTAMVGGGAALAWAGTALVAGGAMVLALGGSNALIQVTSWASIGKLPDLGSGRWVMPGGPNIMSWLLSGVIENGAPFSNFMTDYVEANQLSMPPGNEWWKFWIMGQMQIDY